MGIRHLTCSPLVHSACVSTSRGQAYRSETPWGRTNPHPCLIRTAVTWPSIVGLRIAPNQPFRERGAPSTHDHNRPDLVCSHVNVFTTSAVRVQHKVAVYVIVKASMQFVYTLAHFERVGAPVDEQALRVHMDRLLRQQQHLSYLRAKPWPHRLIYPAASSAAALRWECI